ncbi:DUF805 domain-containing protein [Nocardioides sp. GY 10113]|uniref:DUF805 domain-containing protein n=1 Tax=Nocardioides sp. GY 10113 TaxID=2569761 RepID=UPI0010A88441|nr:DUF805 domain-containing protein [Nocardioides sp. GY 10113]TIC87513.1 DUF805 domain-containing protein [Nocardioides sp. GY 10113]
MTFIEAVQVCLAKYVDFTGRAPRSEYWWFFVFNLLVSMGATTVDQIIGGDVVAALAALALLLPGLAVAVRRLHDTGRSGWWVLIVLVPIAGWIVLIVFFVLPGDRFQNRYGFPFEF